MAHGYRILQHWDQWLSQQFLGKSLLEAEAEQISFLLEKHFGKHAILIGAPHQYSLLDMTKIPCHSLVTPIHIKDKKGGQIEGDFHELPILTGSVDLVILPHTLELIDNPRKLLSEACRIIKPEGLIVISGFNPYSAWGLKKIMTKHKKNMPWGTNFIHSHKIKNWLKFADFVMEKHVSALYTPPLKRQSLYKKLHFLEYIGSKCFPMLGGVYLLVARAKVIPLTPIRLKWKQHLSGLRIPSTMTGHTARQFAADEILKDRT